MWCRTVRHGGGSEGETGKWCGWPVLFTLPRNVVYPALLPLIRTPWLPVVDWTDAPADLNGLVCFAERRNLVTARVPSHFKRSLHLLSDDALAQAFSRLPVTAVVWVQYQASVRYLCWTNCGWDRFFSAYLVFPSNIPSTGSLCLFIHLSPILKNSYPQRR